MNIRDIIDFNDNKFIIIGKIDYENKTYYYIVDINKNDNFKYCYQDNNELVELDDYNLIQKLIPIFGEQAMKEIKRLIEINNN